MAMEGPIFSRKYTSSFMVHGPFSSQPAMLVYWSGDLLNSKSCAAIHLNWFPPSDSWTLRYRSWNWKPCWRVVKAAVGAGESRCKKPKSWRWRFGEEGRFFFPTRLLEVFLPRKLLVFCWWDRNMAMVRGQNFCTYLGTTPKLHDFLKKESVSFSFARSILSFFKFWTTKKSRKEHISS